MQIEKALINDRLHFSEVSRKLRSPTIYNFTVIYPATFAILLKSSLLVVYLLTASLPFCLQSKH